MATKKKTAAKKTAKKTAAKKTAAKKTAAKKTAAKKTAAKKTAAKKTAAKKAAKKATKKTAAPAKKATKKAAQKKAAPAKKAAKTATSKAAPKAAPAAVEKVASAGEELAPAAGAVEAALPPRPARPAAPPDPTIDLAQAIAFLALDKKAEDVVILKVSDLTSYADCFILASAPSERQVQAIARNVDDEMRKAGKAPVGTEGLEQGHWVLVDLGAVVLHVFLSSARQYYDLEGFWADAPRIDVDEARGKDKLEAMRAAHEERRAAAANE